MLLQKISHVSDWFWRLVEHIAQSPLEGRAVKWWSSIQFLSNDLVLNAIMSSPPKASPEQQRLQQIQKKLQMFSRIQDSMLFSLNLEGVCTCCGGEEKKVEQIWESINRFSLFGSTVSIIRHVLARHHHTWCEKKTEREKKEMCTSTWRPGGGDKGE